MTVNASVSSENRDMPMMIEIRGGKVVFKQKAMSLEKITETMQGARPFSFYSSPFVMEPLTLYIYRTSQVSGTTRADRREARTRPNRSSCRASAAHSEACPREVRTCRLSIASYVFKHSTATNPWYQYPNTYNASSCQWKATMTRKPRRIHAHFPCQSLKLQSSTSPHVSITELTRLREARHLPHCAFGDGK